MELRSNVRALSKISELRAHADPFFSNAFNVGRTFTSAASCAVCSLSCDANIVVISGVAYARESESTTGASSTNGGAIVSSRASMRHTFIVAKPHTRLVLIF